MGTSPVLQLITDDVLMLDSSNISIRDMFPTLEKLIFTGVKNINLETLRRLKHTDLQDLSLNHSQVNVSDNQYGISIKNRLVVPVLGDPSSFGQVLWECFPTLTTLTINNHLLGNARAKSIITAYGESKHLKSIRFGLNSVSFKVYLSASFNTNYPIKSRGLRFEI